MIGVSKGWTRSVFYWHESIMAEARIGATAPRAENRLGRSVDPVPDSFFFPGIPRDITAMQQ
jgi:hypothetical protein